MVFEARISGDIDFAKYARKNLVPYGCRIVTGEHKNGPHVYVANATKGYRIGYPTSIFARMDRWHDLVKKYAQMMGVWKDAKPRDKVSPTTPPQRTKISQGMVKAMLRDMGCKLTAVPTDSDYVALPRTEWDGIIRQSRVDTTKYVAQEYDCDNFALALYDEIVNGRRLRACAMVVDYSGKHAYNILFVSTHDGPKCHILEPQTDHIMERGGSGQYKMKQGYVIF